MAENIIKAASKQKNASIFAEIKDTNLAAAELNTMKNLIKNYSEV